MLKFGIIAEGPTDQTVIENLLIGYFDDQELAVHYVQPPRPLTEQTAGWGHVFKSLERKDHEGALQFNDYLVIHIDTDVQEDPGFDVPRRDGSRELSVSERVDGVIARLNNEMDAEFRQAHVDRILYAIAVDSIECWLLPLLYSEKKAAKTTGCLEAANRGLRRRNSDALSTADNKFVRAYQKASNGFLHRKTIIGVRDKNPSLASFLDQLDDLRVKLVATQSATLQQNEEVAGGTGPVPDSTCEK